MKKYLIIMSTIAAIAHTFQSFAGEYEPNGSENCSTYESISLIRPCPTLSDGTHQMIIGGDVNSIKSCKSCKSGFVLKSKTVTDCGKTYKYNTCSGTCSATCGDNTTEWTTVKRGYETREYEYCIAGTTCKKKTQYRCATGYYGTSTDGSSGCTSCPSRLFGATTTPPNNPDSASIFLSVGITACYFPAYTDINDEPSGTYHYTDTCYYNTDPIILYPVS